jgi:hypothetical protein
MTKQDNPQASDLIELAKYETDPQKRLRLITAARTLMLIAAGDDIEQPHERLHLDGQPDSEKPQVPDQPRGHKISRT